jgi:hypothetical protein
MNHASFWALAVTAILITDAFAQQSSQEQQATFGKARAACLEGRGYTVR